MNEDLPDPSASDPERIRRELEAETARELAKSATAERKRGEERKVSKRPADSDAETVLPEHTLPIGGTSVYRMLHPASPISAGVVSALMAALALVAGSGIGMSLTYVPTAERAYTTTLMLQESSIGSWLRGVHYHGTNVLIYLCMMYLVHLLWSGFFRRPGQWIWWRALTLALLVFVFAFTGQLLPHDQLALHGTNTRMGYMREAPVIGESVYRFLTGGSLGTASLARFFALHAIVLPALGAILLRRFWRDGRQALNSKTSLSLHVMLISATTALVLFLAAISSAPLGLGGNLNESFKEARPEWYALPLYQLIKLTHPGTLAPFVLFGLPFIIGGGLLILPWLERVGAQQARLRWTVRGATIGLLILAVALGLWPVLEDMNADEGKGAGWFARHDVESIMEKMKRRNDALGNGREDTPENTPALAHDLLVLTEQLKRPLRAASNEERRKFPERAALVNYYMDANSGQIDDIRIKRWSEWVADLEKAALELYTANDIASAKAAREKIRGICLSCHDSNDVFEPLNPKARGYLEAPAKVEPPRDPPKDPPKDPPRNEPFFNEAKLKSLTADSAPAKPKDLMRRTRVRIVELMKVAELFKDDKPPMRTGEQIFLDLQNYAKATPGMYPEFKDFTSETEWKKSAAAGEAALLALLKANKGEDFKKKLDAYGQTCDDCHKLVEVDFRFADIVKPK